MSSNEFALVVQERNVIGKGLNRLRREGSVPAVIHDHGKQSQHVMVAYNELQKIFNAAGKHHPVTLNLGSKKYMALIKDVDFEPRKHMLRHVVFNAIKANEKQQTEVPVHLTGEIPAEKAGYLVIRTLDAVSIEALPKDLVDALEIDASKLAEIGDKLTVADIVAPAGVTIITEAEHGIAVVEETKAQMSEESEQEAEGAEPAGSAENTEETTTDQSASE